MSIGTRIYEARLERGMSQRELAGETITRNMLSLLEHDQANPSLETLRYLAGRLGKKISYFLEEDSLELPGLESMTQARKAYEDGDYFRCLELLEQMEGEEVLGRERELLWAEATLAGAEQALAQGKGLYCRTLLQRAAPRLRRCPYGAQAICARMNFLLARSAKTPQELRSAAAQLPELDEILLLKAAAALAGENPARAAALLDAVENRDSVRWSILRGNAAFGLENWEEALVCYQKAEPQAPGEVRKGMQLCYAKLKNFEKAYEYATME